ncbi:MAG: hypothetical protein L6R35_002237, partial [Caloplaca aegaea]
MSLRNLVAVALTTGPLLTAALPAVITTYYCNTVTSYDAVAGWPADNPACWPAGGIVVTVPDESTSTSLPASTTETTTEATTTENPLPSATEDPTSTTADPLPPTTTPDISIITSTSISITTTMDE